MKFPVALTLLLPIVQAHTRLECPPPRSGQTGEKVGPCDAPDDPSLPAYPLQPGALNTITWLESIPHPGAPARFALSFDGDDSLESFESCLLLDHVPHDEYSVPVFPDETSWHRSSITLWIPDVYCERCHLQLMTVMSDEIHGVPPGTSCAYGGALETGRAAADLPACPVVYHSCSPVSINGTKPRNDLTECDTNEFEQELDWPMKPQDSPQGHYDYSTYYYKGDPGVYNLSTSRLMMTGSPLAACDSAQFCDPVVHMDVRTRVPENASYAAMQGTCAAITGMEVVGFEKGVLPSVPRNASEPLVPPSGETDPCMMCALFQPCFAEACALRDKVTGNWSGPAEGCSQGPSFCEFCFPDSPCFGYGATMDESMQEEEEEKEKEETTDATTDATTMPKGNADNPPESSGRSTHGFGRTVVALMTAATATAAMALV